MRKLFVLFAVAAAAVVVPAGASAAPVQATFSESLTQPGGWCGLGGCGGYATIEGVGTVSGVGRVVFVADWISGCSFAEPPEPNTCFTNEQVVLTAKNGDTLTLSGSSDARDDGGLVVPWSVYSGTGRFASVSGTGTFSFNVDFSTQTGTVELSGTLSR